MRFTWAGYGDDVIDHFRKKSLFFRDTRENQEYDAKNRLSIPSPSPEKPVAEIARLKKNLSQKLPEIVLSMASPDSFSSLTVWFVRTGKIVKICSLGIGGKLSW